MVKGTQADSVERLFESESEDVVVLFSQCAEAFERIYSLLIPCRETVSTLDCGRFLQLKDSFLSILKKYVQRLDSKDLILGTALGQLTMDDVSKQTLLVCLVVLADILGRRKWWSGYGSLFCHGLIGIRHVSRRYASESDETFGVNGFAVWRRVREVECFSVQAPSGAC